jgi:3D (Asp-Asp-Asp) domain-containing protein
VALTVAAVAAFCGFALPASGAESSNEADRLRAADDALAARSRAAVLELYALQAQVRRADAELATTRARVTALERERASVAATMRVARRSAAAAHRGLEERLRALYEQGGTDPIAVILSSGSLEDALETIDGLGFAAQQDRMLIARTRAARARLARLEQKLAARAERLGAAARDAESRAAALAAREAERSAYVESLTRERRLNAQQIAALQQAASAAHARSETLVSPEASGTALLDAVPAGPAEPTEPAAVSVGAPGARTMVVAATAYAIRGRTASGLPTSWGVAAVDPSVIPLGTRFFVPGYGEAVAADVGSSVRGNRIDLWFPSDAQARAWGRRTVSIVIR